MALSARGTLVKGVVWYDDDAASPTVADFPGTSQKGDLLVDATNKKLWINTGTDALPVWEEQESSGSPFVLTAEGATQVPLTINAHASQSVDTLLVQASDGTNWFRVNSTGQTLIKDGTYLLPGLAFDTQGTTGLYKVASNAIGIVAGTVLGITVTNGQINLALPIYITASGSPEINIVGDTQAEIKCDHTLIITVDQDNDLSGAATLEVWGGQNGKRVTIHDNPLVVQLGPDSDTPATQQIKSADGLVTGTGSDFELKSGEAAGLDQVGSSIHIMGGQGTGSGAPGSVVIKTSTAAGSSSTVQTHATRVTFAATTMTFAEAYNVVFGTTTGTKIGTVGGAAGQKMAFWGQTAIVQPVLATGSTTDQLITVLQTLGLIRQS